MLDKKDVLYMSVPGAIHAITLSDLRILNDDMHSTNAINTVSLSKGEMMTFGPNTRKGVIDLVANNLLNFRCLCMYDSEASFN